MRPLSVPALILVLALAAAVPAAALPAQPGTQNPECSGDWSPEPAAATVRDKADRLFRRLVDAARTDVKVEGKAVRYDGNPELVVDLDLAVIGGSPAAAFSAGLGLNAPGRTIGGADHSARDLVYTTNALYEMCGQPEATIFIAHELGHLALGHAKILEAEKARLAGELFASWEAAHTVPDGEPPAATVRRFLHDDGAKLERALLPIQAPLERQADDYGRELSRKIGVPVETAAKAFLRAQDWLWAVRADMSDEGHGGTVAQRAEESAKWAAARRKDEENAKTATRRAECAARGMSCR